MWDLLTNKFGFKSDDVRVLTDERATKADILYRLDWLVSHAKPGTHLVFHYSGHGSQVRDRDEKDELDDQLDKIICPTDLDWDDPLTDDIIASYLKRVADGVTLTFICDACHSGTIDRGLIGPSNPHSVLARFLPPPFDIAARSKGRDIPINHFGGKDIADRGLGDVHVISQKHVLLSGCRDTQTSADAYID